MKPVGLIIATMKLCMIAADCKRSSNYLKKKIAYICFFSSVFTRLLLSKNMKECMAYRTCMLWWFVKIIKVTYRRYRYSQLAFIFILTEASAQLNMWWVLFLFFSEYFHKDPLKRTCILTTLMRFRLLDVDVWKVSGCAMQ